MEELDLKLSKQERKELKREQDRQKQRRKQNLSNFMKWGIIGGAVILLGLGGWFLLQQSSQPLPGKVVSDLGREHVTDGTKVDYNSNPPTSGSHFVEWTRAGVYEGPISDGHLVHSLEHGYIILSYNCEKKFSIFNFQFSIPQGYAHEEELVSTSSAKAATESAKLEGKVWESEECVELKAKLSDIAKGNRLWKLILIPRPSLDASIALTAWGRIDKMNRIDNERIARFIDAYRDKGPEKTVE